MSWGSHPRGSNSSASTWASRSQRPWNSLNPPPSGNPEETDMPHSIEIEPGWMLEAVALFLVAVIFIMGLAFVKAFDWLHQRWAQMRLDRAKIQVESMPPYRVTKGEPEAAEQALKV